MAPYLIYSNEVNTIYSDIYYDDTNQGLAGTQGGCECAIVQAVERCASQHIPTNNQCDNFKNIK